MEKNSLFNATIKGIIWKLSERFFAGLVTIIITIILARILTPDDYSSVGIVTIFYTLANVFVNNGLGSSLIRKNDADIHDYSTAFFANIVISIIVYLILFIIAPLIADIYGDNSLTELLRVLGINIIVNSIKSIVCAYISNRMEFREFFFATIIGTIISGLIGVYMAMNGFGPWSIVIQQITNALIDTILLYYITKIKIAFVFSYNKFKSLLNFGWKMFISAFINSLYENLNPLIIGIKYSPSDLSYYSKGNLYPNYINSLVSDSITAVLFPAMSKLQDNTKGLLKYTRNFIQLSSYILFPLLIGFAVISDNFVNVLLTNKWIECSFYIKIFSISYMLSIITRGNLQVIKALGRSDIYLRLEIIKKAIYVVFIIAFLFLTNSPKKFVYVLIFNSIIAMIINSYPNKKLINYSLLNQIKDMLPNLIMSLVMAIPVYLVNLLSYESLFIMIIQILIGIIVYVLISILFKPRGYICLLAILKNLKNE